LCHAVCFYDASVSGKIKVVRLAASTVPTQKGGGDGFLR
jgi:hypothetical protein